MVGHFYSECQTIISNNLLNNDAQPPFLFAHGYRHFKRDVALTVGRALARRYVRKIIMKAYHFISEEHLFKVISKQRLKVSMLDDLNDPFELKSAFFSNKKSRQMAKNFKKDMADRFGILCFSKVWRNPVLWSHYANRHKGAAIEFEINDKIALPIRYRKNRYQLKSNIQNRKFGKKDIEGIWLTKYQDWAYEEEVRVILEKKECVKENGFLFKNLDAEIVLKGLILGALCQIDITSIENALPTKKSISVMKARLAFQSFDIVTQKQFRKTVVTGK